MRAVEENCQIALERVPPIRHAARQRAAPAEDIVPQAAAGFGNQVQRRAHVGVFARFDQNWAHGTPLAWSGKWYPMSHQATTSIPRPRKAVGVQPCYFPLISQLRPPAA